MKALKISGFVLAGILALFLILGLFAPKHAYVVRSTEIAASPETVFAALNDLRTWELWSPWQERDSTIKNVYSEPTTGKGAYFTWTSENSGNGKLTILDVMPNDSLSTQLEFEGMGASFSGFRLEPTANGTRVSWDMASDFTYPFNAMMLFMDFEGNIAKDYDRGLELLRAYVANQKPAAPAYEIKETNFAEHYYLGLRKTVSMAEMSDFFTREMGALIAAASKANVALTGAPSGLYFVWDEAGGKADMAVAIPVATGATLAGYTAIKIPAARSLQIDYYGPYAGTGPAHYAIDDYAKAKNLALGEPALEEYVTDPQQEPDTAKWLTRIVYFVK